MLLGHSNISQTSNYLNVRPGGAHEALARYEAALCNPIATEDGTSGISGALNATDAHRNAQEITARHH